jgi:hypothetical protein
MARKSSKKVSNSEKPAARAARAEKSVAPMPIVAPAANPEPPLPLPVAPRAAAPSTPLAAMAAPAADAPAASRTEEIAARAHAIWIAKGSPNPGTPLEDWLQAEREISASRRR